MDVALTIILLVVGLLLGGVLVHLSEKPYFDSKLEEATRRSRDEAAKEAVKQSSAVLKGQIGERMAPFYAGFHYEPADARFLGSPIDYVVFDGLSKGEIKSVAFVEVKTGRASLTPFQRQVQDAIRSGKMEWRVVELPD